jgi:heme oxygenase (biliverdin-IX-beta and delta-forming)
MTATDVGATKVGFERPGAPAFLLSTFGHALGCLYVLQGSYLGGRTIADAVQATISEAPTSFLAGHGQSHPAPWASVCSALALFDAQRGDGDAVVSPACATFAAFADHLGRVPASGLPLASTPE